MTLDSIRNSCDVLILSSHVEHTQKGSIGGVRQPWQALMRRCPCFRQVFISPLFCWNAEVESKVVIGVISDHDESGYNL